MPAVFERLLRLSTVITPPTSTAATSTAANIPSQRRAPGRLERSGICSYIGRVLSCETFNLSVENGRSVRWELSEDAARWGETHFHARYNEAISSCFSVR